MIKVEILTPYHTYTLNYPNTKSFQEAYDDAFKKLYTDGEVFTSNEGILDITDPKDIKHIKVYDDVAEKLKGFPNLGPIVEPPPEKEPINGENYYTYFAALTDYMDHKVSIEGVKTIYEGVPFMMIYRVDGQDALDRLKPKSLEELTTYYAAERGYNGAIAVIPHGGIPDEDEALAYLEDYIEELRKAEQRAMETKHMNARAVAFWNEDE
jgi:hypothetical protein